ncbi:MULTISPECIES: hypothetical protein [unclassified Halobacterium]|uniref:hypothetical protein n=1 Tax=unclassified Halobacterium TaxID=2668073 RepID=UPI001E5F9DD8|nr:MULTISPECIES: hypothetical protein [unclassified Halobacterium]MCD2200715.1 hypothetical protein [Halobacterium sp. KA-4]MCD2203983.1 hypothetical protein [Halobacterium sp. KA-6]
MSDPTDMPNPPADYPENVASTLQELSVHDLRETIIYAQELLQFHHVPTDQIEPTPGEEIVELTEHQGYTEVVKRQPCGNECADCPHGPYVYHVTRERHPNGDEKLHWVLIGRKISEDA